MSIQGAEQHRHSPRVCAASWQAAAAAWKDKIHEPGSSEAESGHFSKELASLACRNLGSTSHRQHPQSHRHSGEALTGADALGFAVYSLSLPQSCQDPSPPQCVSALLGAWTSLPADYHVIHPFHGTMPAESYTCTETAGGGKIPIFTLKIYLCSIHQFLMFQ